MRIRSLRALFLVALALNTAAAAESGPLASPEVTSALKPYLDSYKLAGAMHDILRYGLMLANNGEWEGRRYLSRSAMDELRKEQTGTTRVNYSLGYHLRNGLFGHDGAYGTDLSVNPTTGMVAVFMVQCPGPDQWAARDLFLKTAAQVFEKAVR